MLALLLPLGAPALPLHEAGKYVAGAYVVFLALLLIYLAIMGLVAAGAAANEALPAYFDLRQSWPAIIQFAGLTAYDTQRIKEMYFEGDAADVMGRKAIMGALTLYLDFINMFQFLLSLFGSRNE